MAANKIRTCRRGFTMTELAIVLGIIGLVLGAIWVAAGQVNNNRRYARATQETITITENIRTLFPNGAVNANPAGDLTASFIAAGVFPADMIQTCPAGAIDAVDPCPVHPWGGEVVAGSQTGFQGATASPALIEIEFAAIPANSCPAFMAAVIGQGMRGGLVWASSDGGGSFNVTASTALTDPRISGCSGNVVFQFAMTG